MNTSTQTARGEVPESNLPLDLMFDLPVEITIELGRRKMTIGEFLDLGPGAVLELRKLVGDPLEIRVNQRLVARGEAVAVGEMYGVRITEVLQKRASAATPGTSPIVPGATPGVSVGASGGFPGAPSPAPASAMGSLGPVGPFGADPR